MSKLEEVEAILVDLGFGPSSSVVQRKMGMSAGSWFHKTKLVGVECLDEEVCWEAVLFARRENRFGVYFAETGRVRLSNLSHAQFETVLGSLL